MDSQSEIYFRRANRETDLGRLFFGVVFVVCLISGAAILFDMATDGKYSKLPHQTTTRGLNQ